MLHNPVFREEWKRIGESVVTTPNRHIPTNERDKWKIYMDILTTFSEAARTDTWRRRDQRFLSNLAPDRIHQTTQIVHLHRTEQLY